MESHTSNEILSGPSVIYRVNRKKPIVILNMLIGLGFIYFLGNKLYNYWVGEPDYMWVAIHAFFLTFFVRGLFVQGRYFIKNTPILAISHLGIFSDMHGILTKDEITDVTLSDVDNPRTVLFIYINNSDAFISRQSGIKKALFNKIYQEKGTPVAVNLKNTFSYTFDRSALEDAIDVFMNDKKSQ